MQAHDRDVAGIRCTEVLEELSDYLDGELRSEQAARIEAHLRGCDWCERFGGDFGDAVVRLRDRLGAPATPSDELHTRLMAELDRVREHPEE